MTTGGLRLVAILIAVLGTIDPAITLERPVRQPLTIAVQQNPGRPGAVERHGSPESQQAMASAVTLRGLLDDDYDAHIRVVGAGGRAAACAPGVPCVFVGGDRWTAPVADGLSPFVGAVRVPAREGPSVVIARATVPTAPHASAVGRLDVVLVGRGVIGQRSTIEVVDGDVPIGRGTHEWAEDGEATVRLDWWPMDDGVRTLSVRTMRADATAEDDRIVIGAAVEASAHRVLVYDTRPSWTSTFVRRAIEQDRRLSVRLVARLGPQLQVSAGEPFRLDAATLADASAVVIGALDDLSPGDVDVLDTFVRVRGGSLVLVPDRKPTGPAARLIGGVPGRRDGPVLVEQLEPSPIRIGDWRASELLLFRNLPDGISTLARVGDRTSGDAVVVAIPSGNGRVVISGLMDAWRYRDADGAAFDRAWQSLMADAAAAGGRPLEVTLDRAVVAPSEDVHVTVRVRAMSRIDGEVRLGATVACGDEPPRALRLWPTGDRQRFEGHVAPSTAGPCRIAASSSGPVTATATADLIVQGSDPVERIASVRETAALGGETATDTGLDRLMHGSDGRAIAPGDETTLARDVRQLVPAQAAAASVRPMRSAWWIGPFAACLGAEWWLRRRRGLR